MASNKISDGGRLSLVAGTAKTSGAVEINGGDTIGIVGDTVASGEEYGLHVSGEFELAKATGVNLTAGEDVYWDTTAPGTITTVKSNNTRIGVAAKSAVTLAAKGRVLLNHPNVQLDPQT